jgi:hypothetical protein
MTTHLTLEDCVDQAFSLVQPEVHARFADDPVGVLRFDFGLSVRAVEHLTEGRSDGGACDGVSFLRDGVILYAPTPLSRRENFTLAHELGHWLVENAPDVYDWLADQNDPGRLLETVCDRIAQRLLLPDSVVSAVVGAKRNISFVCTTRHRRVDPCARLRSPNTYPALGRSHSLTNAFARSHIQA